MATETRQQTIERMRKRLGREPTDAEIKLAIRYMQLHANDVMMRDGMLTPDEEADLREHAKEASDYFRKTCAHLRRG